MKTVAILTLLALALAIGSCGTRTPTTTVETTTNASWEAQLIGGLGQASELNFVTQFSVSNINGGPTEPLGIAGFSFINAGTCFTSDETESGSAQLSTNTAHQVTGSMAYTVASGNPHGNVLTLCANSTAAGCPSPPTGGVSGTSNATPGTVGPLSNGIAWGTWTLTNTNDAACTGGGTFIMCQAAATCTIP